MDEIHERRFLSVIEKESWIGLKFDEIEERDRLKKDDDLMGVGWFDLKPY